MLSFYCKRISKRIWGKFWISWGKYGKLQKKIYVPIVKQVTEVDKDGNESAVTMSSKIKRINSARFVATSISNLDNLTEGIHKFKCKGCDCFLEYERIWKCYG